MSEAEQTAALEKIQLELFALERVYGDVVQDFYTKRREILKRRRLLLNTQKQIVNHGQKCCRKCGAVKDVTSFYKEKRYADGRRPHCITCDAARMKQYNERKRMGNVISRGKAA